MLTLILWTKFGNRIGAWVELHGSVVSYGCVVLCVLSVELGGGVLRDLWTMAAPHLGGWLCRAYDITVVARHDFLA